MAEPIQWTKEMDNQLGRKVDREVAIDLGVAIKTVYFRRHELGIPSFSHVHWTPEMETLLGTMSDADLGDLLDINPQSVRYRRRRLGITAFLPHVKWTSEMENLLGTASDQKVADVLDIGVGAVQLRRYDLGIPSWTSQQHFPNRKHKKLGLADTLTYEQWRFACVWFGHRCAYCGAKTILSEDHLVPLSMRGPRTVLNIIPACVSCNSSKSNKQAHLWIYQKFGMEKGKEIINRIVAYLTEVS